jgi:predicted phage tail protein
MDMIIAGAGGGGKGGAGGGGISESPDTLQSVATARMVDLIGEGPMGGLVNGEFSIYLDGVPLRDLSGTANYKPFQWTAVNGYPTQNVLPGFAGSAQEVAVSLRVLQPQGKLIRSIPDATADSVRVTVSVNGLTETTSEGKINGSYVTYTISVRVVGGSWVKVVDGNIQGKTTSRYQRSHEVPLKDLGAGPYEVAVERVKVEATSSLVVDGLYWDSYSIINYEQYTYPYSALVGIGIDARYFSNVPERAYHVKGLIIQVPTNYDPIHRTYTGTWDGTFKWAWSNNPAWCFYDLVTNARYGLGRRINGAAVPSKWELYQIAKYCDEMVPSGLANNLIGISLTGGVSKNGSISPAMPRYTGPYEPRFTLNVVLNTVDDAYKVISNLTSVFRGMAYWSGGQIVLSQDRPTPVSMLWNNANVIDGQFNYQGSSLAQRHTAITVGWNDPDESFKQKFEYVKDAEGIKRYGLRQTETVAFGTTSRGQARRVGLWMLYTERLETDAITFKAGLDSANVKPGDVGQILDRNRFGARWGGRVISATTSQVTLDAPVTLTPGVYTLSIMQKDGTVDSRSVNIVTAGDYTVLNMAASWTTAPAVMAVWVLSSATVSPMTVRVVSVKPSKGVYEITVLQHEPSKYDAIEQGLPLHVEDYSFLSYGAVPKVANLKAVESSYKPTVTSSVVTELDISWDKATDIMVRGYRVKVTNNATLVSQTLTETAEISATLQNLTVGNYTVTVNAINVLGAPGPDATYSITITGIDSTPPANVTGFAYQLNVANGLTLTWNPVADYIDAYEIREGTVWETATKVDRLNATSKTLGAVTAGTHNYLIKAIDTSGNLSTTATSLSVTVNAAAAPSPQWTLVGSDEIISWAIPSSVFKIDRYEIRVGATFAASVYVDTTKATSLRRKVDYVGGRTYWVTAYDVLDNAGAAGSLTVNINAPGDITAPRSEVVDNNVLLYWQPPATGSLPVDRYEVRKGASYAGGAVVGSNGNSTFCGVFEQQSGTYSYWVAAIDTAGNVGSSKAITATVSQPPDYVLRTSIDSAFAGTKTNALIDNGRLLLPVNVAETFAQHFTNNGWSTPNAQVSAGYPLYVDPTPSSGSYDETFDYGTVLPATNIVVTIGSAVVQGTPNLSLQIYYKQNLGDAWIAATVNSYSVLATNFRYVRVVATVTGSTGKDLLSINSLNVKLSSKLKTDSGTYTITDANAGATVTFNVPFIDADTPSCQANSTTPIFEAVSFADLPNPTTFTVWHYNSAGAKVTGSGSWTARGY